jgi:protein O-GlcNAc transferase
MMTIQQAIQHGMSLHQAGRMADAEAVYRQILAQDPNQAEALHLLGMVAFQNGQSETALELMNRSIQLKPGVAGFFNNLGGVLAALLRQEEAAAAFRQAIALRGEHPEAWNNLGNVLRETGQLHEALDAYRRAAVLWPDYREAHSNLGLALKDCGQIAEAQAEFERALAIEPDNRSVQDDRLYTMHFVPGADPGEIARAHRDWGHRMADPLGQSARPHEQDRSPDRPLRIGYLSPDLRMHPVAFFLLPLLEARDRGQFHVTCYSSLAREDSITARCRAACDGWQNLMRVTDEEADELIRRDRIDILVDLAGHTGRNRLALMARKPAPVQVTYLGYPNTTGAAAIDYRLTDEQADPPGVDEWFTERLVRLPRTAWCFTPLSGSPPTEAGDRDFVAFGCFNDMAKINEPLLRMWAAIVTQVPGSRLVIKNRATGDMPICARLWRTLETMGLPPDRVDLLPPQQSVEEHLRSYAKLDVALDAFPYHGTATTCEALWMGVPVVTLAGKAHVSRVGVSLLNSAGLGDLIAQDESQYVRTAVALAADGPRRDELRRALRGRMAGSPLMDGPGLAREVEAAYRRMWRQWAGQ